MSETHEQFRCPTCGFLCIWKPYIVPPSERTRSVVVDSEWMPSDDEHYIVWVRVRFAVDDDGVDILGGSIVRLDGDEFTRGSYSALCRQFNERFMRSLEEPDAHTHWQELVMQAREDWE